MIKTLLLPCFLHAFLELYDYTSAQNWTSGGNVFQQSSEINKFAGSTGPFPSIGPTSVAFQSWSNPPSSDPLFQSPQQINTFTPILPASPSSSHSREWLQNSQSSFGPPGPQPTSFLPGAAVPWNANSSAQSSFEDNGRPRQQWQFGSDLVPSSSGYNSYPAPAQIPSLGYGSQQPSSYVGSVGPSGGCQTGSCGGFDSQGPIYPPAEQPQPPAWGGGAGFGGQFPTSGYPSPSLPTYQGQQPTSNYGGQNTIVAPCGGFNSGGYSSGGQTGGYGGYGGGCGQGTIGGNCGGNIGTRLGGTGTSGPCFIQLVQSDIVGIAPYNVIDNSRGPACLRACACDQPRCKSAVYDDVTYQCSLYDQYAGSGTCGFVSLSSYSSRLPGIYTQPGALVSSPSSAAAPAQSPTFPGVTSSENVAEPQTPPPAASPVVVSGGQSSSSESSRTTHGGSSGSPLPSAAPPLPAAAASVKRRRFVRQSVYGAAPSTYPQPPVPDCGSCFGGASCPSSCGYPQQSVYTQTQPIAPAPYSQERSYLQQPTSYVCDGCSTGSCPSGCPSQGGYGSVPQPSNYAQPQPSSYGQQPSYPQPPAVPSCGGCSSGSCIPGCPSTGGYGSQAPIPPSCPTSPYGTSCLRNIGTYHALAYGPTGVVGACIVYSPTKTIFKLRAEGCPGSGPCTSGVPKFSAPQKQLIGYVFKSTSGITFESCVSMCQQDSRCKSGDFFNENSECNLKSVDRSDRPDLYIDTRPENGKSTYFEPGCHLTGSGNQTRASRFTPRKQFPNKPKKPFSAGNCKNPDYFVIRDQLRDIPFNTFEHVTLAECLAACDNDKAPDGNVIYCSGFAHSSSTNRSACLIYSTPNDEMENSFVTAKGTLYFRKFCLPGNEGPVCSGTAVQPDAAADLEIQETIDAKTLDRCLLECINAKKNRGYVCASGQFTIDEEKCELSAVTTSDLKRRTGTFFFDSGCAPPVKTASVNGQNDLEVRKLTVDDEDEDSNVLVEDDVVADENGDEGTALNRTPSAHAARIRDVAAVETARNFTSRSNEGNIEKTPRKQRGNDILSGSSEAASFRKLSENEKGNASGNGWGKWSPCQYMFDRKVFRIRTRNCGQGDVECQKNKFELDPCVFIDVPKRH